MIRESSWEIVWDVLGTPRTLMTYEDLMDGEISLNEAQLVVTEASDFELSGTPIGRGNAKRRMEFTVRKGHASAEASWQAALDALAVGPWGKRYLAVTPRGGSPRIYRAAALRYGAGPDNTDGYTETVHKYAFRIGSGTALDGDGLDILDGRFNPDSTFTLYFPSNPDWTAGDVIYIRDNGIIPNGFYPVISKTGNRVKFGPGSIPAETLETAAPLQELTVSTQWGNSEGGGSIAVIRGINFTSALPFWVGTVGSVYAAGTYFLGGIAGNRSFGIWAGVTNGGPDQDITWPAANDTLVWGLVGGVARTINIPMQATGTVNYSGSAPTTQVIDLTPMDYTVTAGGTAVLQPGDIPPGGTATKTTLTP